MGTEKYAIQNVTFFIFLSVQNYQFCPKFHPNFEFCPNLLQLLKGTDI